jgi:hypothetical protein
MRHRVMILYKPPAMKRCERVMCCVPQRKAKAPQFPQSISVHESLFFKQTL